MSEDYVHPRLRLQETVCVDCHYIGFTVYTDKIGNVVLIKCMHCGKESEVTHTRRKRRQRSS